MCRPSLRLALTAFVLLAVGAAAWAYMRDGREPRGPLGLFTSLPIYWSEAEDLSAMLDPQREPHWARRLIEGQRELRPLDVLTPETLAPLEDVLLAQPRALAPAENVALDDWVRRGGRVLLFADPLLTEKSHFPIGDRRRPQDVALLSPILSHWGLELHYDEGGQPDETMRDVMGAEVPSNLAGYFTTGGQANCRLWTEGFAVTCAIGRGRIVAVADAAVLEGADLTGKRPGALLMLLDTAFAVR